MSGRLPDEALRELYGELAVRLRPLGDETVLAVRHVDECDSTQRLCHAILDENRQMSQAPLVAVVLAEHQTDGHGREGRTWQDTPGASLLTSIGLDASRASTRLEGLQQRIVRAIVATLSQALPLSEGTLVVREPNDIYEQATERKLGGVLVDVASTGATVTRVVLGCGLNIAGAPFHVDGREATTIEALTGEATIPVGAVIGASLEELILL